MKKGFLEIVFILDRSGSMSGLETDTIGGFNGLLEKQQKNKGEAVFSTILFDDFVEVLHDRLPIADVKPMTANEYSVRGCPAFLDAVGGAIKHIKKVQKEMPKSERPEKTLFVITTDGLENASTTFSYSKVKKMIEKRQTKGWEFLFLGANMDAIAEGEKFGINAHHSVSFHNDEQGTMVNYSALNEAVSMARVNTRLKEAISKTWKGKTEDDFVSRK